MSNSGILPVHHNTDDSIAKSIACHVFSLKNLCHDVSFTRYAPIVRRCRQRDATAEELYDSDVKSLNTLFVVNTVGEPIVSFLNQQWEVNSKLNVVVFTSHARRMCSASKELSHPEQLRVCNVCNFDEMALNIVKLFVLYEMDWDFFSNELLQEHPLVTVSDTMSKCVVSVIGPKAEVAHTLASSSSPPAVYYAKSLCLMHIKAYKPYRVERSDDGGYQEVESDSEEVPDVSGQSTYKAAIDMDDDNAEYSCKVPVTSFVPVPVHQPKKDCKCDEVQECKPQRLEIALVKGRTRDRDSRVLRAAASVSSDEDSVQVKSKGDGVHPAAASDYQPVEADDQVYVTAAYPAATAAYPTPVAPVAPACDPVPVYQPPAYQPPAYQPPAYQPPACAPSPAPACAPPVNYPPPVHPTAYVPLKASCPPVAQPLPCAPAPVTCSGSTCTGPATCTGTSSACNAPATSCKTSSGTSCKTKTAYKSGYPSSSSQCDEEDTSATGGGSPGSAGMNWKLVLLAVIVVVVACVLVVLKYSPLVISAFVLISLVVVYMVTRNDNKY